MRRALSVLGGFFVLAAGCLATHPAVPVTSRAVPVVSAEQDYQQLLSRLSQLSDAIGRNTQSPNLWRYQLAQGEVVQKLAARSRTEDRDSWLRMAVDSYQSAAILSPDNELTAHRRLLEVASDSPDSPVSRYAALQEIHVDSLRVLGKSGIRTTKAQEQQRDSMVRFAQGQLRERLLQFVQEFPKAPETPQVVLEVAQISESLKEIANARRYYRFLAEHCPEPTVARKAGRALWQLGLAGETMHLKLPLLFASPGDHAFDVEDVGEPVVVAYFWSSTSAQSEEDFRNLKQLTDRYRGRGLEIVYVNLDRDPANAREFLSGRLLAGVHVFQEGGLDSPLAVRYGIQTLPQAFVIGKDGVLKRHALQVAELESEVSGACVASVSTRYR